MSLDKELIRNKLECFMNYRKVYLRDKKELMLTYLNEKSPHLLEKIKSIKFEYQDEFSKFNEILPDDLKLDESVFDEDLIMWLIFTLNDVLNPIEKSELPTIINRSEINSNK